RHLRRTEGPHRRLVGSIEPFRRNLGRFFRTYNQPTLQPFRRKEQKICQKRCSISVPVLFRPINTRTAADGSLTRHMLPTQHMSVRTLRCSVTLGCTTTLGCSSTLGCTVTLWCTVTLGWAVTLGC